MNGMNVVGNRSYDDDVICYGAFVGEAKPFKCESIFFFFVLRHWAWSAPVGRRIQFSLFNFNLTRTDKHTHTHTHTHTNTALTRIATRTRSYASIISYTGADHWALCIGQPIEKKRDEEAPESAPLLVVLVLKIYMANL